MRPIKYLIPVKVHCLTHKLWPLLGQALAIFSVPLSLYAQDISNGAGTAEFQYIETLIAARPAGLAGAYTSISEGADAIGYNPAGVSKQEGDRFFSGTFRQHLIGVSTGNATYAYPGANNYRYAFSVAFINYGKIEEVVEENQSTGRKIIPSSINPSFTVAKKFSDQIRGGVSFKGFQEYLGDFEESQFALGWGLDAGILIQPSAKNLGFGLSVLNVGRKEVSQLVGGKNGGLLPASLKGGLYYYPREIPKTRLVADLEIPYFDPPLLSGGFEYYYTPQFVLRAGSRINLPEAKYYFLKATDQRPGEFSGGNALKMAGGFTFLGEEFDLDYAVQYWMDLSWVHAVTLKCPVGM